MTQILEDNLVSRALSDVSRSGALVESLKSTHISTKVTEEVRALMKNKNSSGPRMEPCGTPERVEKKRDMQTSKEIWQKRLER